MEIVIDAHIIASYYQESVGCADSKLTDATEAIFERVGVLDRIYLDDGEQIENEWRRMADPEWFEAWYASLLASDAALLVPVAGCSDLRKKLEGHGFPRGSRDFWYVRTAKAVAEVFAEAILLTEDMDFYEPSKKGVSGKQRENILRCSGGQIAKHLRKKEKIRVTCVASHLNSTESEQA